MRFKLQRPEFTGIVPQGLSCLSLQDQRLKYSPHGPFQEKPAGPWPRGSIVKGPGPKAKIKKSHFLAQAHCHGTEQRDARRGLVTPTKEIDVEGCHQPSLPAQPSLGQRGGHQEGVRQRSPCVHIPGSKEPCEALSSETRLFPIVSRGTGSSLLSSAEHVYLSCLLRSQDTTIEGFLGLLS